MNEIANENGITDGIRINGLTYQYPDGTLALDGLDLFLPFHKRTVLLGANGCGKSTLLRHLDGLLLPQKGSITFGERQLDKKSADEIRKKTGLLFDNPDNMLFSPSVEADVGFGPSNLRMETGVIRTRVDNALRTVRIEELRERSPYNLSLGQKKRCAIAGILAMEPDILLMDEPYSGLDPQSLAQFSETLDLLFQNGMTQIMSTHDVDLAYEWADRVIVLSKGKVLRSGGPELMRDAELMEDAGLMLPGLVRLFSGTGVCPSSFAEAKDMLIRGQHFSL